MRGVVENTDVVVKGMRVVSKQDIVVDDIEGYKQIAGWCDGTKVGKDRAAIECLCR